jgi:hypothetical protein
MVQIKKEQLKKIIQKEYINVLKEVKANEAHFNQVAYEHVIRTLIKEGVLDEQLGIENAISSMMPGSSANKMKRALGPEEEPQYGETWGDARTRMGYGGQPANPEEEAMATQPPSDLGGIPPDVQGEQGPVPSTGDEQQEQHAMPAHLEIDLRTVAKSAHQALRGKIIQVGSEVYNSLTKDLTGIRSSTAIGKLTVAIIQAVIKGMGKSGERNWLASVPDEVNLASELGREVPSELEKLMAVDPESEYPEEPRGQLRRAAE